MATTQDLYDANGSTTSYPFTFPYLKTTDIKVQLDSDITTAWSLSNATTITFDTAPASGKRIKIYRETDTETSPATFYAGSAIKSEDLNDNFTQNLYSNQEVNARYLSNLGGTMVGNLNMGEDTTIIFEGATDDTYETTLTVTDPTADRTITLPNVTGTVVTTGDTGTVTSTMITDGTIASSDIANDAINSQHYAAGSIDLEHMSANSVDSDQYVDGSIDLIHMSANSVDSDQYVDGSIDLAHMSANSVDSDQYVDGSIDHIHLANDIIDGDNIQDDVINSEHIAAGAIDLEHMSANSVDSAQYVDGSIDSAHIANDQIDSQHYAAGSIDLEHMSANSVDSDQYVDGSIDSAHIGNDQIDSQHYAAGSIDLEHMSANSVDSDQYIDGSIDRIHLEADIIDDTKLADDAVKSEHLLDHASDDAQRAVTTNHIKDNAVTIAKLGCEETTLTTNSNTVIPTSKAVADHVANVVDSIGGFKVIANKDSFPEAHPDPKGDAGMVISVTDPVGFVINGSGVSTTGDTITSDGTVTINGFPSEVYSTTTTSNYTLLLQTTSTAHTYDFYRFLAKDADVLNLSSDIDDFGNRYRTGANRTANNSNTNHDGDLFFDQTANKMYVYDGAYDSGGSWKEVTSTGEFKILTVVADGATSGSPTFNGPADGGTDIVSFDLRDGSNAASVSQVGQLIVSVNGVVQKPNSGTYSSSEEGFYLEGSNGIKFCTAPNAGSSVFVTQCGSAVTINVPADDSVTAAKLNAGTETTGHFLSKTASGSGMAWAAVPAGVGGANGADFNDNVKLRFGTHVDAQIGHLGTPGITIECLTPSDGSSSEGPISLKATSLNQVLTYSGSNITASLGYPTSFLYGTVNITGIVSNEAGHLRIIEGTNAVGQSNYVELTVPDNGITNNYTITLPAAAPTANGQALVATTAGVASWDTVSSTSIGGCGYQNDQEITGTHSIPVNKGMHSVGPITNSGTVTVSGRWVIS